MLIPQTRVCGHHGCIQRARSWHSAFLPICPSVYLQDRFIFILFIMIFFNPWRFYICKTFFWSPVVSSSYSTWWTHTDLLSLQCSRSESLYCGHFILSWLDFVSCVCWNIHSLFISTVFAIHDQFDPMIKSNHPCVFLSCHKRWLCLAALCHEVLLPPPALLPRWCVWRSGGVRFSSLCLQPPTLWGFQEQEE